MKNDGASITGASVQGSVLRDLTIVFALGLGVRLLWAVLTPPWTAPDEPPHFTYVAHLVEQGEIPHESSQETHPEFSEEMLESWQHTFFGRLSRAGGQAKAELAYLPVHHDYRAARRHNRAPELRRTRAAVSATAYPPFYYLFVSGGYSALYERPILSRLYAVRALSGLLGALSACFAYLLAYELRRELRFGRAVGLSMALFPMHVFITASVNNDAAVVLASTILCWLLAKVLLAEALSARLGAAIGMAAGAILMTKPSGVPVALLAGALLLWRAFPIRRSPLQVHTPNLVSLSTFALTFLSTAGAWNVYRFTAHASAEAGADTQEGRALTQFFSPAGHSFLEYLQYEFELGVGYFRRILIGTYWGNFGWLELPLPRSTEYLILASYGLALVGLIILVREQASERRKIALLACLLVFNVLFLFIAADYAFGFASTGAGVGMQGRYFFPTLSCLLCLLCFGLARIFARLRFNAAILPVLVGFVQLISLRLMLSRWYGVHIW